MELYVDRIKKILTQKKKKKIQFCGYVGIEKKELPLGIVILNSVSLKEKFLECIPYFVSNFCIVDNTGRKSKTSNAYFISHIQREWNEAFDFMILDNDAVNVHEFFRAGIVPIVPENYHLKSVLQEFDAFSGEGNAFFYKEDNIWTLVIALTRLLENYKFPYDFQSIIKNVLYIH